MKIYYLNNHIFNLKTIFVFNEFVCLSDLDLSAENKYIVGFELLFDLSALNICF